MLYICFYYGENYIIPADQALRFPELVICVARIKGAFNLVPSVWV